MMQGLIKKYKEKQAKSLAIWSELGQKEPARNNSEWWRGTGYQSGRLNLLAHIIKDLKEADVSVDNALDASTAMINELQEEVQALGEVRHREVSRRDNKIDELYAEIRDLKRRNKDLGNTAAGHARNLDEARAEIEDLRDAVEANGTDDAADALRYGVDCWNPNERPSREGDEVEYHCPDCTSGETFIFEGLDWVQHCMDCGRVFRITEAAAPPPVEEAKKVDETFKFSAASAAERPEENLYSNWLKSTEEAEALKTLKAAGWSVDDMGSVINGDGYIILGKKQTHE